MFCSPARLGAQVSADATASVSHTRQQDSADSTDYRWSLFRLTGERTTLAAFRSKVLVINSWATWCEPCVAELKSLAALRAAVPDTTVAFLLIAPQRPEPVLQFVRRRRVTLPVFLEAQAAPAVFGFEAVPTTWIVAPGGRIVLRQRGAVRWDTPAMISRLRQLARGDSL
jgi:thiol-disulfide isomerase/thioredoxin